MLNKVLLIGNLGKTPEIRHTSSGKSVTTLSLATNEDYTNTKGEKTTNTQWHQVVVWGKAAENCAKYLVKGRSVYVEGRLQTRTYKDKSNTTHYVTEVIAASVKFMPGGPRTAQDVKGEVNTNTEIPPEACTDQEEQQGTPVHVQDVNFG